MLLLALLTCGDTSRTLEVPAAEPGETDASPADDSSADDSPPDDSPPDDSSPPTDTADDTAQPPPFVLAILPDTQAYVESDALNVFFEAQTAWLAQRGDVAFVTHLGDVVSHGGEDTISPGNADEWARADAAMTLLDAAGLPWGIAVGNHELDQVDVLSSGYSAYLETFGPWRFEGADWFGGASANELNTWQTVSRDGVDLLFLHLELDVPDTAIAWADGVMGAHPGWPTVVSTHSHRGPLSTPYLSGEDRNSADAVREQLISRHDQIFLVLNGHHGVEEHAIVKNGDCRPVLEMALDYSSREDGGGSWLGLLEIDPWSGALTRSTYAPAIDAWETDADSAFSYTWDWNERFSGAPAGDGDAIFADAEIVDDFSADTSASYVLSDSYGSGGAFSIVDGELVLRPGASNTVTVARAAAEVEVGQRWSVRSLETDNVMFMVSTAPAQPDGVSELGFRWRRDTEGLRLETYAPEVSLSDYLIADPGGALTLEIARVAPTTFGFSIVDACGERTEVAEAELTGAAGIDALHVGIQAWSTSSGAQIRFDDLRREAL